MLELPGAPDINVPKVPPRDSMDLVGMFVHAPPVMITGTGRSATTYTARLLQHLGINCGHENWWTPLAQRQRFELDADSSWMAAPFMDPIRVGSRTLTYDGTKLLQTREPLAVISSYLGVNGGQFMAGGNPDDPYWRLHIATLPRLAFSTDAVYNAASWWYEMNRHSLDRADHWWRVEQIDGDFLQQICKWAGWTIDPDLCAAAVTEVPTNTHTARSALGKRSLDWDEIPQPVRGQCQELATELGYTPTSSAGSVHTP